VRLEHVEKVHPIQLIAREDQHVVDARLFEVSQVLADRIGRPLIPVGSDKRLLSRENLDKSPVKAIEGIRLADVTDLDGQIAIVDPEYIVCWGAVAAQNLLDSTDSIGRMRGRFYEYGRAKVLCTYHPSYLLRNPPAKKQVWDDMKFLFHDMGIELD